MKSSDSPTRATPPQWVNTAALNIAREFYAQEYSESDHARLVSIIVSALAEASCEATPPPQPDWMNALREYAELREEIGRLEEIGECGCDPNEFHTCELCKETSALDHRAVTLMHLWGDTWAMKLHGLAISAKGLL
jgi:hypothetical protein